MGSPSTPVSLWLIGLYVSRLSGGSSVPRLPATTYLTQWEVRYRLRPPCVPTVSSTILLQSTLKSLGVLRLTRGPRVPPRWCLSRRKVCEVPPSRTLSTLPSRPLVSLGGPSRPDLGPQSDTTPLPYFGWTEESRQESSECGDPLFVVMDNEESLPFLETTPLSYLFQSSDSFVRTWVLG